MEKGENFMLRDELKNVKSGFPSFPPLLSTKSSQSTFMKTRVTYHYYDRGVINEDISAI